MRQIFIGLFILAFLAGITAKIVRDSKDDTSMVGHMLNAIGFKNNEDIQKSKINEIVHKYDLQRSGINDYLQSQEQSLSSSKILMGSLSQLIQERLDKDTNVDLLRLKELMQRFQDKSDLLIEHGRQLAELNQNRLKINQAMANEADWSNYISESDRMRFLENIQTKLDQQKAILDKHKVESQGVQQEMKQVLDKVNDLRSDAIFKQDPELVQKLQHVIERSKVVFNSVKDQSQKFEDINIRNLEDLKVMKDKIHDKQQKTLDSKELVQQSKFDQAKALNDQLKEKIRNLQDQRIK